MYGGTSTPTIFTSKATGSAQRNPDGLRLGVLVHSFQPVVAPAKTGLPVAAERRGDIALAVPVDGHGSRPDPASGPQRHVDVLGPHGSRQPVRGVVGQS